MTTQPNTPEKVGNQVRILNFLRKSGKAFGILLSVLLSFFIFFNLLLHIPYFQKSAISGLSLTVSTYLGTPNKIGSISLSGLTEFRINKFYLEDPDGDTLLYSDKIYARLNTNIFKIFTQGLIIYQLKITDGQINIKELSIYIGYCSKSSQDQIKDLIKNYYPVSNFFFLREIFSENIFLD
jgi:hypothetical protein